MHLDVSPQSISSLQFCVHIPPVLQNIYQSQVKGGVRAILTATDYWDVLKPPALFPGEELVSVYFFFEML